jgi:hypothetical protein
MQGSTPLSIEQINSIRLMFWLAFIGKQALCLPSSLLSNLTIKPDKVRVVCVPDVVRERYDLCLYELIK